VIAFSLLASLMPLKNGTDAQSNRVQKGADGNHLSDHFQLCAAGLCLEERTEKTISHGEIFTTSTVAVRKCPLRPNSGSDETRSQWLVKLPKARCLLQSTILEVPCL
jgi:hypothetical protein